MTAVLSVLCISDTRTRLSCNLSDPKSRISLRNIIKMRRFKQFSCSLIKREQDKSRKDKTFEQCVHQEQINTSLKTYFSARQIKALNWQSSLRL